MKQQIKNVLVFLGFLKKEKGIEVTDAATGKVPIAHKLVSNRRAQYNSMPDIYFSVYIDYEFMGYYKNVLAVCKHHPTLKKSSLYRVFNKAEQSDKVRRTYEKESHLVMECFK